MSHIKSIPLDTFYMVNKSYKKYPGYYLYEGDTFYMANEPYKKYPDTFYMVDTFYM